MKENKLNNITSTGFNTPKDYFESIEDNVFSRLSEEKIRNKVDKSGLKHPDNYFDSLEDNVIKQVSEVQEPKVISLFSKRNLIYASSIAAAIIIMLSLTLSTNNANFTDLETATVESYILEENISSYEIASLLSEEDMLEDVYVDHDLNKENIETYLMENVSLDELMIE